MSLKEINKKLLKAWKQVLPDSIPRILTLEFMGSRYYTFDDFDDNLYEFYSIDCDVYKANKDKCEEMLDQEYDEPYYELQGDINLVVITSSKEINEDMKEILRIFKELMR